MRWICTIMLLLCLQTLHAGNYKSILKLIEKGKYTKAFEQAQKDIDKDLYHPGACFVMSILYINNDFPAYQQDSAWNYIVRAEKSIVDLDEKSKNKLSRAGITAETIEQQKRMVDSVIYHTIIPVDNITTYNHFIVSHPDSPYKQNVIEKRDQLAWEYTNSIDTYQAYHDFLKKYPNAKQVEDAQIRYEVLLYEEKTEDNNLTSFIQFLNDFPDTPHRLNAETHIFKLGAAGKGASGYVWFLKNYPESKLKEQAENFLYHLYKENNDPIGFYNQYALPPTDSLLAVMELEYVTLVPFYSNGHFGFNDTHWQEIIAPQFEKIEESLLCGNITSDILTVTHQNQQLIITKRGYPIYKGSLISVEDLGYGFLKIVNPDNMAALWHKSGQQILDNKYQDFKVLDSRFIKFRKGDKWGLCSFAGIMLLDNQYDDLFMINEVVATKNDKGIALTNVEQILNGKDNALGLYLDEVEALDDSHLLGLLDDQEMLIGKDLSILIPAGNHQIYQLNQGWIVKAPDHVKAYTSSVTPVFDTIFSTAVYNERWFALKNENKWAFFADEKTFSQGFIYDSVHLISTNFAFLNTNGNYNIYCNSKNAIELPVNAKVRVLSARKNAGLEFLMVVDRNKKMVYDTLGQLVLQGVYDQISMLGNDYFLIESGGRKGLADHKGVILIKPQYEAIGNYNQGFVSLLKSKKFGIYNSHKKLNISPQYDGIIQPFGDSLLLATTGNLWGLIDFNNKVVLKFEYKEILPWNQDQVIVKNTDNLFSIVDLKNKHIVYSGIERIKKIKEDKEEQVLLILKKSQHGILSSKSGEIIAPAFTDITNMGSEDMPIYFAQRTIREAEFIVVVYFSADGGILSRMAMTEDEFDKVYCE